MGKDVLHGKAEGGIRLDHLGDQVAAIFGDVDIGGDVVLAY